MIVQGVAICFFFSELGGQCPKPLCHRHPFILGWFIRISVMVYNPYITG